MDSLRLLISEALYLVFVRGRKPKNALESISGGLDERDRAFLMEVAYGVIRRRDTLDWALGGFLKAPGRLKARTLNNLRAGTYQTLFMRVPEWAAVNETVEAEKTDRALVNAVLRNVLRKKAELLEGLREMEAVALSPKAGAAERIGAIAIVTSHPPWLVKRWVKRFGPEEAMALAKANNEVPPLTLRVNLMRAGREEVVERLKGMGIEGTPTEHSAAGIRLRGTVPFRALVPLRGLVSVQDEAAQLMTYLLAPAEGERILDACAAPGGKTTHIAQMMKDSGEIVAVDLDAARLDALRENVSAFGLRSVKVVEADAGALAGIGMFDRALLDAPCSSTGVIRRNPDVKYRHRSKNLQAFKGKQLRLLRAVSALVKPGGVLLYCTCSTEPEEGEEVMGEFLKTTGGSFIIDNGRFFPELTADGFIRTFPHRHDMDGFFGVRLKRVL